jgi:hypothetical protein
LNHTIETIFHILSNETMAETQQHTPPGGWPWSKGKDASDSKDAPPEYFDDKKKSLDTKKVDDKKSEKKKVDQPEQEWVEDNSVAGDSQKPLDDVDDAKDQTNNIANDVDKETKEVNDAAKDGVEVTKEPEEMDNPLDDLRAGLKAGDKDKADTDNLKDVDLESLTDEEKKKLTPGGGLDNINTDKVDDAADTKDAEDKVKDTKDTAEDKVEDTKDTAEDKLNDTKDTAEDKLNDAKDTTEDKLDDTKDTAEDKLDDTKDTAKDTAETELPERPKEGEEAVEGVKDGELKEGELPKEGEDAVEDVKEGELPKEGEEAVDDTKDKLPEGEDVAKEGEDVVKEGEEAVKEGEEAAEEAEPEVDLSILKGGRVNKGGNVVDDKMNVVGRIKDGVLANLIGKRVDEKGVIWSDSGKVLGHAECESHAHISQI